MDRYHVTDLDEDIPFEAIELPDPVCFWCWLPLTCGTDVEQGCHPACAEDVAHHCSRAETRH